MGRVRASHICWDLDETLGCFRDYSCLRMTPGIKPLLEGLRRAGLHHVVTTAGSAEHADYVLQASGIRGLFEGIFDYTRICDAHFNKYYSIVASSLGITPLEAPHRMLVVGNLERDAPADLDLTFIMHPMGAKYSSRVYLAAIGGLLSASDSWADAHAIMGAGSSPIPMGYFEGGLISVEGVRLAVGRSFWNPRPGKTSDRIVAVLDSPDRMRIKKEDYSACTVPLTVATASLSGASG
ncbi:MAG: HAD family hydrolase [Candidatus Micrarchaeota archaeon]